LAAAEASISDRQMEHLEAPEEELPKYARGISAFGKRERKSSRHALLSSTAARASEDEPDDNLPSS
jgi:hypothetical protein